MTIFTILSIKKIMKLIFIGNLYFEIKRKIYENRKLKKL